MLFLPLLALLPVQADSLKSLDIEEAVVVASPKETRRLRQQPVSVSLFNTELIHQRQIKSVKELSSFAPNFYMPSYGSRLTSACYIRGIGSRINTPAVGMYVDNVPYVDKTAYDFSFSGIDRVDVLRGPQGTLYGRNTMGGLVRIFTADPLTHYGTDLEAGLATAWNESHTMQRKASATTFLHPAERMGLSLGAYYEGSDGFFRNEATGQKQDGSEAGGARVRWAWQPTQVVKLDWTASYEQSNEKACPYFLLGQSASFDTDFRTASKGTTWGTLAQNRPSSYRRSMLNTGLSVEHRWEQLVMSSITAFQHINDRLFMDQDFTANDIFSLCQKQQMNTATEEISLKSAPNSNKRWTWTTGFFTMYQAQRTTCPVTFYNEGVSYLNGQMAQYMPSSPQLNLTFTGSEIPFSSLLKTPSVNAALFHQSTVRLVGGLSATLGLRLDYEHRSLNLQSGAGNEGVPYHFGISMGPAMSFDTNLQADPTLNGRLKHDTWQVLPKAALNYSLPRDLGNLYVSVAKGYRSGGYNIQSYSDLSQQLLRRQIMLGVRDFSVASINSISYLPEATKQKAIAGMTSVLDQVTPQAPDLHSLYYKPEYTWSYEAGIHHNLADKLLQLDLSAFYMKTRNQQIARFSESGLGRVMVNAGQSKSVGVEAAVRSLLLNERLQLATSYGYTKAEFTRYDLGTSSAGVEVDYTGNRVPFVPMHTFSASADFTQPLNNGLLRSFAIGADVKGAGNILWDEANSFGQNFYATLGAHLDLLFEGNVSLSFWGRNLSATRYATFAFDSMGNRFAQYAMPRCIGMDLKWHF